MPIEDPQKMLQEWYTAKRGKASFLIQANNHPSLLQHALAYFHYTSVTDPLSIPLEVERFLKQLKSGHLYHLQHVTPLKFNYLNYNRTVAHQIRNLVRTLFYCALNRWINSA